MLSGTAELSFLDFIESFAIDALVGSRSGFQATNTDFNTAGIAITIIVIGNQFDGTVDFLDQSAFTVAGTQFDAELFFKSGSVCWVWWICRFVLHVMYGAIHFLHQLVAPIQKNAFEMIFLIFIHVLLALFDVIRVEAFAITINGGGYCFHGGF